jgi:hypothetical protein
MTSVYEWGNPVKREVPKRIHLHSVNYILVTISNNEKVRRFGVPSHPSRITP